MSTRTKTVRRLERVRNELGDLAESVVLVGGSAAALFEFDIAGLDIRETADVDLVVRGGYVAWQRLQDELRDRSFRPDPEHHICRLVKGDLALDVMASDPNARGLSTNRWYEATFATRVRHPGTGLHAATPVHFLATKLEAFLSPDRRFGGDYYASHDIEDAVLTLFAMGSLRHELETGSEPLHAFIRYELSQRLAAAPDALTLIQAHLPGDAPSQSHAEGLLRWMLSLS